uniref:Uncharacterized protein n=1 Tax=viral metagenome TaxID=1070528 RepID=A0A6C0KR86_9ZZZZ
MAYILSTEQAYNSAHSNYLTLLHKLSAKWKSKALIDEREFNAVTQALTATVTSAQLMMNEAKDIMDDDIILLAQSRANFDRDADNSIIEHNSIIEATGRAFNIFASRQSMLSHYTRTEAEARATYNYALEAYNTALANEIWWNDLMPTLKEENKKYGSLMRTWMYDFNEKIPPGASFDAISEFGRARGRANKRKYSLHKRKPRKRKNRTYKNW